MAAETDTVLLGVPAAPVLQAAALGVRVSLPSCQTLHTRPKPQRAGK